MLPVHRVQRDVGAVAKSLCQSGCHHSSVQGQTPCRPPPSRPHIARNIWSLRSWATENVAVFPTETVFRPRDDETEAEHEGFAHLASIR